MNKVRRKAISDIIAQVEALKEQIESIAGDIECVKDEELEYLDNIPVNLQGSERYETAEAAVEALEAAYDTVSDLSDALDEVTSSLDEATGQ